VGQNKEEENIVTVIGQREYDERNLGMRKTE
jgi:hypothetical protein